MPSTATSYEAPLANALVIGRYIVGFLNRNRVLDGSVLWPVLQFTKIVGEARTVRLLLRHGHTWEAKLIVRAICEDMANLSYIVEGPGFLRERIRAFEAAFYEDAYAELRFVADHAKSQCPERFFAKIPWAKDLMRGRQHHVVPDKPWDETDLHTKLECVGLDPRFRKLLLYTITAAGNATAHSRPSSLENYCTLNPDGRVILRTHPTGDGGRLDLYSPERLSLDASLCLFVSSGKMLVWFGIEGRIREEYADLSGMIHKLARTIAE